MTEDFKRGGKNAAEHVMREAELHICVAQVKIGRLLMFSDYELGPATLDALTQIDKRLNESADHLTKLREQWVGKPPEPNGGLA